MIKFKNSYPNALNKLQKLLFIDTNNASKINFPTEDITNIDNRYFEFRDSIVFNHGKYQILSLNQPNKNKLALHAVKLSLVVSGCMYTYFGLYNILYLHPLKSVIWFSLSVFCFRTYQSIIENRKFIITSISLLENCKSVELHLNKESFVVDIKEIRKLKQNESIFILKIMPFIIDEYFPIIVKNQFYLIPKRIEVANSELLKAITEGKYIDLKKGVKINESEILNLMYF